MFEFFTLQGAAAMLAVLVALALAGLLLGQRRRRVVVAGERVRVLEDMAASLRAYEELLNDPAATGEWDDESAHRIRSRFEDCRNLQRTTLPELGAETVAALATQGRLLDHLWRRRLLALRRPLAGVPVGEDPQFQELLQLHLDSIRQLLARCDSVASAAKRDNPSQPGSAAAPPATLSDARG